jgi:hypothetical protein
MRQTTRAKTAWRESGATANVLERRKEPRSPAQGVVQLLFEDPAPQVINAELRDVSASGFRAVHHCSTLSSGLEVRFTHDLGHGRARVVWTLTLPGVVQSGFLIVGA